jgi:REP element-mobilizing transposase RayT
MARRPAHDAPNLTKLSSCVSFNAGQLRYADRMPTDAAYAAYVEHQSRRRRQPRTKPHRLPVANYTLSDCTYFFTINAHDRRSKPFRNAALAHGVVASLQTTAERHKWKLYSYCLMPDHLHFVAALPEGAAREIDVGFRGIVPESILDHIAAFKRYTTTQLWWKLGGHGRLWQRSSYDRVIWHDDSPLAANRYVLNNPVRAGLAADWHEYPFAGIVDTL